MSATSQSALSASGLCGSATMAAFDLPAAQGLDGAWLMAMQKFLPPPSLTVVLDIAPETALTRKATDRDRYERDLSMQARVRRSYQTQAVAEDWVVVDGERDRDAVAADVFSAVASRLGLP